MGHTTPDNFLLKVPGVTNHLIGHRKDPKIIAEKALGGSLTQVEVTSFWVTKTLDYITENPFDYVRGQLQKLHHLFAMISTSVVSEQVGVWRFERNVLRWAVFDFASIFALFAAAALCCWRRKELTSTNLYMITGGLGYLLASMLTIVLERYRIGTLVFMIPLASFMFIKLATVWRECFPEIVVSFSVFLMSYSLMLAAPARYDEQQYKENTRRSELKSRVSGTEGFYALRGRIDKKLTTDNCLELFIALEKANHKLDINRAKIGCSKLLAKYEG